MIGKTNTIQVKLLILAISVFFITTGVLGLIDYDSTLNQISRAFNDLFKVKDNRTLTVVVALVQIAVGILLLLDIFSIFKTNVRIIIRLIIFILWAVFMFMTHIANNFLEPNFLKWLQPFSRDLIILASLWLIWTQK